ncbi:MAG: hypothetical protein M1839_000934 [Geoglossum umbratile]|nr:MAG: hypothetical protein M1839_000934 [Geoglossum umbratile]
MSAIADVQSLKSAALSCPSLYHAFSGAETMITTRVLSSQVSNGVLPEAAAALESSQLDPPTAQGIQNFVKKHLCRRRLPPRSWTLCDALSVGKFHLCLSSFATKFANTSLTNEPLRSATPTQSERDRIERALYRFEIFCNLFRNSNVANVEDQQDLFFTKFSPWEMEQLGCIHDFLIRQVSPAFNDIAEHDIVWGKFNVRFGDRIDSPYIQHLLSFGLQKLHQISTAETYEARHTLLYSRYGPEVTINFLYEALRLANKADGLGDPFPGFTLENQRTLAKAPFFRDPDTGPADVWRWTHNDGTRYRLIYRKHQPRLREWGYVMWDRSRFDDIGIFNSPWKPREISADASWEQYRKVKRQTEYMRSSWAARSGIFALGGRGWWSWGDSSKIAVAAYTDARAARHPEASIGAALAAYLHVRAAAILYRHGVPPKPAATGTTDDNAADRQRPT